MSNLMHRPSRSQEEDILLSIHRHRIKNLPKVAQSYSPFPPPQQQYFDDGVASERRPRNGDMNKQEEEQFVWDKVNKSKMLPKELNDQFGGEARQRAADNYAWKEDDIIDFENMKPRLIDEMMTNRTTQRKTQSDHHSEHLRYLSKERERLLEARRILEDKKKNFRGVTPIKPITPDYQPEASFYSEPDHQMIRDRLLIPSRAESSQSVMDVDTFITKTKDRIPYDTQKVEKLRREFDTHYQQKYRPYNGELGPQSYEDWQMEGYQVVRSVLDGFVDRFLDNFFRVLPPAVEKDIAYAMIQADKREWEQRRIALAKAKAVQLIMEELVLEETSDMCDSIAEEFLIGWKYLVNKSNLSYMKTAEVIATMDEGGRSSEDSAYNMITKGFYNLQGDRDKYRSQVWTHTQHLHLQGPQADEDDDEDDDDVEILDTHPISPMEIREYAPKPHDDAEARVPKEAYMNYQQREVQHWGGMMSNVYSVSLSSKCQGVGSTKVSPNQRFLACGTVHGDISVYDLWWEPIRPVGVIHNHNKNDDPIISVAWSGDSTRIVSVSQSGDLIIWTTGGARSSKEAKADSKSMDMKKDSIGLLPNQFTPLVIMDAENQDFSFQIGPLAEHGAQNGVFGPTLAAFHPTRTFLGQQHAVVTAVENHDVIRCNFEEALTIKDGMPYQECVKSHQPTVPPADGYQNYIGQGVPAELFRRHRLDIVLIGFVDNFKSMVTVDWKTNINLWRYNNASLSEYDWFKPYKTYRLEKTKVMYQPTTNAQPNIIFTDRVQGGKKPRSRQEIGQERRKAEQTITELKLKDPWHREYLADQNIMTSIYPPNSEVPAPGAMFHVIMRHADSNQLSTYLTRLYKPTKVNSTKFIGVKQTPNGDQLIFVMLFPEFPPKEAHLSVFVVDLRTMKLRDFRRDISIENASLYSNVVNEDIVSFDVSPVLGTTGGCYLFINLAGELSAFSLNTGMRILRVENAKKPKTDGFSGCRLKESGIPLSPYNKLVVAGTLNKFFIIAYADKRDKTNANKLMVVELADVTPGEERSITWEAFRAWEEHPEVPTQDMRVDAVEMDLHNQHITVAMNNIIMGLADYAVQRKHGNFTEEEMDAIEVSDRIENYSRLEPDIKGRRTPDAAVHKADGNNDTGSASSNQARTPSVGVRSGRGSQPQVNQPTPGQ